jgi:hypothetical protein
MKKTKNNQQTQKKRDKMSENGKKEQNHNKTNGDLSEPELEQAKFDCPNKSAGPNIKAKPNPNIKPPEYCGVIQIFGPKKKKNDR